MLADIHNYSYCDVCFLCVCVSIYVLYLSDIAVDYGLSDKLLYWRIWHSV